MIRNLLILAFAFALGALIAVAVRAALHRPYAAPAPASVPAPAAPPPAPAHQHGAAPVPAPAPAASKPVNTICPGCGGPVDPALPTATYQGKTIGFNCAMCPPRFAADPAKYGEAALKNQVVE
jgi:hypothetical protein